MSFTTASEDVEEALDSGIPEENRSIAILWNAVPMERLINRIA